MYVVTTLYIACSLTLGLDIRNHLLISVNRGNGGTSEEPITFHSAELEGQLANQQFAPKSAPLGASPTAPILFRQGPIVFNLTLGIQQTYL
jgi:hypothetical protein